MGAADNVFRESLLDKFNINNYKNSINYYPRKENLTNFSRHDGAGYGKLIIGAV